jgi:ABC-type phosphate/phosphonate transport system substrate-binding protein
MYDLPELRSATAALWDAFAAELRRQGVDDVPAALSHPTDLREAWRSPSLFFSQSCGYPLVTDLVDRVSVVGAPVYDADGSDGATYRSAIVVRADRGARSLPELRGTVAAVNERTSHSGYNALRAMVAPLAHGAPFFASVQTTGAHTASIDAVTAGQADVAAIDGVTLALLRKHRPTTVAALRVLAWSEPAPALPFITAITGPDPAVLRNAVRAVLRDEKTAGARAALLLRDVTPATFATYAPIAEMASRAVALGYPEVR